MKQHLFTLRSAILLSIGLLTSLSVSAADDFFSTIEVDTDEAITSDDVFQSRGFVHQKLKYGIGTPDTDFAFQRDESNISQIQTDVFYELGGNFSETLKFQISAKAELDLLQWEDGESEWELNHEKLFLKDAYLDARFDNGLWLRAGHQIFAWGESESLSVTDVISPSDLREFGQAELRDLREHVPALMLSLPALGGNISLVTTYDAGHNRYADSDEDFYPYIALAPFETQAIYQDPSNLWEAALKVDYSFNGGDISIVLADINNNEFSLRGVEQDFSRIYLSQDRVTTLGLAANKVVDSWLFKGELGHFWNQPVQADDFSTQKQDQLRAMLGLEFNGWNDWMFSYELNLISVLDSEPESLSSEDNDARELGQVARISLNSFNERLSQQLWLLSLIQDNGSVIRYDLAYDLNDSWELTAGLVIYENSNQNSPLYAFRHHDTLNLTVKFSF